MSQIIRSDEEIEAAAMRAQKAAFDAEDDGGRDDEADAIYRFWQWMTGNAGDDPTSEMGESL